nr:hypothetical protein CFP56_34999 [Quercus suber]POE73291.1 hypothetical protein CFP56_75648 [Quercus suber]
MRPSSYPKGFSPDESNDVSSNSEPKFSQPWHLNGRCPEGTIPIRRTKEEDLLRAGSAANYGRKKHHFILSTDNAGIIHEHAVLVEDGDKYYGMLANMNVWNPKTMDSNEFSISQFWMTAGDSADFDTIEAGITVDDNLYGDYQTRLFTYWTDDGYKRTGCRNLDCPGFVQVNNQIATGATVTPYSSYGGDQRTLEFYVYKDIDGNGDWWLRIAERDFGYWPSSLFSLLSNSASSVQWGGEVTNIMLGDKHTTTQMGSGHFPEEGPGKASFFNTLNVIDGKTVQRPPWNSHTVITNPNCYNLIVNSEDFFYYGGPGRNPNCP